VLYPQLRNSGGRSSIYVLIILHGRLARRPESDGDLKEYEEKEGVIQGGARNDPVFDLLIKS
jgi:hypothetical protein